MASAAAGCSSHRERPTSRESAPSVKIASVAAGLSDTTRVANRASVGSAWCCCRTPNRSAAARRNHRCRQRYDCYRPHWCRPTGYSPHGCPRVSSRACRRAAAGPRVCGAPIVGEDTKMGVLSHEKAPEHACTSMMKKRRHVARAPPRGSSSENERGSSPGSGSQHSPSRPGGQWRESDVAAARVALQIPLQWRGRTGIEPVSVSRALKISCHRAVCATRATYRRASRSASAALSAPLSSLRRVS